MRVSAGALYLSAPACVVASCKTLRPAGGAGLQRTHARDALSASGVLRESLRSRTGSLTISARVSPLSPVLPWPGILQPQCEVCDDTVASIHCQVGSVVWRMRAACGPRRIWTARARTHCSLSGLVIFQTRPLTGVNVRLHCRARALARSRPGTGVPKENLRRMRRDPPLGLTHTQLIACMHARA